MNLRPTLSYKACPRYKRACGYGSLCRAAIQVRIESMVETDGQIDRQTDRHIGYKSGPCLSLLRSVKVEC